MDPSVELTGRIKALAIQSGYDLVGVTRPAIDGRDAANITEFIQSGRYGTMDWFPRHNAIREDPVQIFPEAKSVVMLGVVYRDPEYEAVLERSRHKIARYAAGRDYHKVLRKKGKVLLERIHELVPEAKGRITTDSAPVPEKILARQAGLGWQGKHTNLIHPERGSYFFLSALFLDLELHVDDERADLCGQCRLCIDACPTNALEEYRIDARRCISYLTIEHRATPIDPEFHDRMAGWAFGCDICQEVCPYNRSPRGRRNRTREPAFAARGIVRSTLASGDPGHANVWNEMKTGSPLGRISLEKWRENLRLAEASDTHGT